MNNRFKRDKRKLLFIPFGIAAMVLLVGTLVMCLWNAILPDLLQVPRIRFWQAVGLLVLCRLLFGNFGGKGGGPGRFRQEQRRQLRDKWLQMTPEERSHFKEEWRERCRQWRGRRHDDPI